MRIARPHTALPTYIGPICTRCRLSQNQGTGGPYSFTKRTYHYARDNITWLRIGFTNWYANLNSGEASCAASTIAASIEYPFTTSTSGTTARLVTWNGSTSTTAASGVTTWSDWMRCPIPIGAKFGSRLYISNVTTNPYNDPGTYLGAWRDAANGDVLQFSVNATAGGSMTDDGSQIDVTPIIIGYTRRPTVGIIGDSRQCGWGDTVDPNVGDAGDAARTYGKYFGYLNLAIGGDTLASFTSGSNSALRRQLASLCSHLTSDMAINDISSGATASAVEANLLYLRGMPGIAGKPLIYELMYPETTSADGWATTANQTIATYNTVVNQVNTWELGGNIPRCGGLNDPRSAVVNGAVTSGIWNAPGYTADGAHPTQLGYRAIMNGGGIDPRKITYRR